ncbi:hypothetical protein Nepgr_032208 [Nepenthes gracilis]|uniref:Glutamate receptor n=1 Tax=Nepenthes gracilis TaxID=150966 RepID=A0AAD3TI64_NEPGR|nr:hypothetical protein Nepgr_032208 [Nepenthes gracilis]
MKTCMMKAPKMAAGVKNSRPMLWPLCFALLISFYLFSLETAPAEAEADGNGVAAVSIGAIIDGNTRIGKEQTIAMRIQVENFNKKSNDLKLSLHIRNYSSEPLQAVSAALELVKEKKMRAIVGMERWQEAALVAQVGSQHQLPVLSLAAAPNRLQWTPQRWPSLIQMATNYSQQLLCISSLVKHYNWRRVIAVYEDDGYAGTYEILNLLSEYLQDVGSEIEYRLALPPVASMPNPNQMVLDELVKLLSTQSRVFIVLQSSLPLAIYLFREAKSMGLIGRDTAWIVTDSISSLLDSVNSTVISSMEGVLGVKTHYSETGREFNDFYFQFWEEYRAEFPQELYPQPSIHAARAYDAVTAITKAMEQLGNDNIISSSELLQGILSSNFQGLSGEISFEGGELSRGGVLRVINVVGKRYKELDFWSPENGFFERLGEESGRREGMVNWPGDVKDVPRGWAMPVNATPLKIGVPGAALFDRSVKVEKGEDPNNGTEFSGFSIDVFTEVVKILEESYAFSWEFVAFYGSYDDLVNCVYNKTFDAVVGDVTILANRSKHVDFTQPYAKTGMSMIVPFKSKDSQKAWLFMKPFTPRLWLATGAVLLFTAFVVWLLELRTDDHGPESGRGQWKNRLSAVVWFIFCSLFLTHQERIQNNYSRIVVVVWLCVVFVLIQSYTASLTSMLTVPLLKPKIIDVNWLIENNKIVGCDGASFVRSYLTNVVGFKTKNILSVNSQYYFPDYLSNGTIDAAFLELPFERFFLSEYCKTFTDAKQSYRFGGLGFVFQKGSPLVADVSKAILILSENGVLQDLENNWFSFPSECTSSSGNDVESLSVQGFIVLFLFFAVTSAICFLLFLARLLNGYDIERGFTFREKLVRLWRYFDRSEDVSGGSVEGATFVSVSDAPDLDERSPSRRSNGSPQATDHF